MAEKEKTLFERSKKKKHKRALRWFQRRSLHRSLDEPVLLCSAFAPRATSEALALACPVRKNQKLDDDDTDDADDADGLIENRARTFGEKTQLNAPAPHVARGAVPARHGKGFG